MSRLLTRISFSAPFTVCPPEYSLGIARKEQSPLALSDPKGPFYNVTVSRSYKEGDSWKSSDSFGRDDLLVLA
jgi:hypothetical protein